MIDFDTLTFPKLLPGHRWVVKQSTESFSTWDQIEIEIRKDRRFFSWLGFSRTIYLSEARKRLLECDYPDEEIPTEELELWAFYVDRHAAKLHDIYKERLAIPIQNQKVKDAVRGWQDALNVYQPVSDDV